MKESRLIVAIGVLLAGSVPTFAQDWNNYDWRWNPANDHYYALTIGGPVSWGAAQTEAQAVTLAGQLVGAELVTINNQEEQDWLNGEFPIGLGGLWIGLWQDPDDPAYAEPGGGWKWWTGDASPYRNWWGSEPNNDNNNEDRAAMNMVQTGFWMDVPADATYAYFPGIIEVPEPATFSLLALGGLLVTRRRR